IPRADLGRTNTRHLTSADGVKDGGALRGKLKRVAIPARNEDGATASFFNRGCGCEKIVRLVASSFCILKAASRDEFRDEIELLNQSVIELTFALISGKFLMPVGRGVKRVPGGDHSARLLFAVKAQQKVGKAENGASRPPAAPQDGFRQGVVRAMSEGIAVDHQYGSVFGSLCSRYGPLSLRPRRVRYGSSRLGSPRRFSA